MSTASRTIPAPRASTPRRTEPPAARRTIGKSEAWAMIVRDRAAGSPPHSSGLRSCQGRILSEVALDPLKHRLGQLLLETIVAQSQLFVGIRDERRFDEYGRDIGRLEHCEAGLLDGTLVQCADRADAIEHRAPDAKAVVDLGRLGQVEQRSRQQRIAAVEVDAADQVGLVLALREPTRRGARRTMLR